VCNTECVHHYLKHSPNRVSKNQISALYVVRNALHWPVERNVVGRQMYVQYSNSSQQKIQNSNEQMELENLEQM
jgi:hypothetical protein